ncbi:MAG: hypothetical protein ACPLW7_05940, partial [Minisyncoccia bacterium]
YKVNEDGELSWFKTYGKEKNDGSIYITNTKIGYAIMGLTNSYRDGYDILYFTLDKNGGIIWSKRFGGDKDKTYEPRFGTIYQTNDGGFITNTFLNSFGEQGIEVVVLKTDPDGNVNNCPYIKDADVKINDYTKNVIIEKPSYFSYDFNWEIKDAYFEIKDADFTKTTVYEVKPSKPNLLSPNNEELIKNKLNFSWEESINSLNHEIQISEDINFNKIIFTKVLPDTNIELYFDIFQNNKTYYWRVRGLNSTKTGDWSDIFNFKIQKVVPPSKPENLKCILIDNGVKLTWNYSNEGTFPIEGYEIYRSENNKDFNIIGNVDKNSNYFIDTSIEINKTYYYLVKAFDNQIPRNYSEESEIINIKVIDETPPTLNIYYPVDNYMTNQKIIILKGNVIDKLSNVKELKINNMLTTINVNGDFEKELSLIEGINNIIIEAIDYSGNKSQKIINITFDSTAPKIDLSLPNETTEPTILITGSISDNISGVKYLKINNNNISISSDNKFSYNLNLSEGINNILVESEDNAGNETIKKFIVKFIKKIILKLQIGNLVMLVNGIEKEIDVPPQIV